MSIPPKRFIPVTEETLQREIELAVFEVCQRHFPHYSRSWMKNLHDVILRGAKVGLIRYALQCARGNKARASRLADMNRNTFRTYKSRYNVPDYKEYPRELRDIALKLTTRSS